MFRRSEGSSDSLPLRIRLVLVTRDGGDVTLDGVVDGSPRVGWPPVGWPVSLHLRLPETIHGAESAAAVLGGWARGDEVVEVRVVESPRGPVVALGRGAARLTLDLSTPADAR